MNAPAPSSAVRVRLLGLVAAAIGAGLLVLAVQQVGWTIQRGISGIGWWFLLVVVLGGVRFYARARSWILCANRIGAPGLTPAPAFGAVIAGDAVGNLTPLGLLASEPTKVLLVRGALPTAPALTSVALDNGFHTVAVLVMIAVGASLLVRQVSLDPTIRLAAEIVLAAVVVATIAGAWLARRQPAILSRLAQLARGPPDATLAPTTPCATSRHGSTACCAGRRAPCGTAAAWQVAFHAGCGARGVEILRALSGGATSLVDAFVLESAGRLVIMLLKVIPFRMGVDEVGAAVVATALGLPASHGVALALVRKLRILVWNAAGLVVLARARR